MRTDHVALRSFEDDIQKHMYLSSYMIATRLYFIEWL